MPDQPTPPADRAALRKAVADAIRNATCTGNCGKPEEQCARERIQPFAWHHGTLAVVEGSPEQFADAVLPVLPEPADRAAVLREEADRIDATRAQFPIAVQNGITWATAELRRHAAETATTETEAPDIAWHILTHQRGTWRPWLAPRDDHAEAREDYDRCVADNGHRWAFRLVRETSTFTVEAEHQPADGARQEGAQR